MIDKKSKIALIIIGVSFVILIFLAACVEIPHKWDYTAELSGENEVPPVTTNTTGTAKFKINSDSTAIRFELQIKDGIDILGSVGAHIHCGAVGENGDIIAFLAGVIPGGFDGSVTVKANITSDNFFLSEECGTDIKELIESINAGNVYVNVHSIANPSGEIRGQVEKDL